jgi:hypothetical protein
VTVQLYDSRNNKIGQSQKISGKKEFKFQSPSFKKAVFFEGFLEISGE